LTENNIQHDMADTGWRRWGVVILTGVTIAT
jgi:hypothetical protein